MPRRPGQESGHSKSIEMYLTGATESFDNYRTNRNQVQKTILFGKLDHLFNEMNTRKAQALKSTIWLDLYFRLFFAYMNGWGFLLIAFPLFLTAFFVEVFVCYPGNIQKPKAVISITVLCESLEFILQLVICWARLHKGPAFYRKWGIRIKMVSGIVVVVLKAAELYSISKLVPNSDIKTGLDRWSIIGPILFKTLKSLLVLYLNSAEFVFEGNENEIFARYNGRAFGPLINIKERNHILKRVTRMGEHEGGE